MEFSAFPGLEGEAEPTETVALQNVFLHVTKACNLRCAYCYFSANRPLPDELTAEEFAPLWRDLVALRPQKVTFTGGEPLLRSIFAIWLDRMNGLRGSADPVRAWGKSTPEPEHCLYGRYTVREMSRAFAGA